MARVHGIDKADQRLYLLVGFVLVLGTAAVAISVAALLTNGIEDGRPAVGTLAMLGLLAVGGTLLEVRVRVRSAGHSVSWTDAAALVALALVPGPWAVLLIATGVALARAVQRLRPVKSAFAVAKDATTTFLGAQVLLALGLAGSPTQAGVGSLALAYLAMRITDQALAIPVIAAASRTSLAERFRKDWDIRFISDGVRLGLALAAVQALRFEDGLLYVLPVPVVLAYVWHERWVRAREEREAWQTLAKATDVFTGVDLDLVLREAVRKGAPLFSVDELEVEVWLGETRRLVRGGAEITYDGDPAQAPTGQSQVYAVALHGSRGRPDIGALRLRFRDKIKLSERDQAMVSAYAAALDTAVRNAAAYQQLGAAKAEHAYAAAHDALTGLANRRELERQLVEALADPRAAAARIALVMIDLRHFKEVNDALGHQAGDGVLAEVARRLVAAAAPDDLVTRFGGDEFAVLLRHVWAAPHAQERARQLLATFEEPLEVDGLPIMVEATGGVALALDPQDETELAEEVERALARDQPGPAGGPSPVLLRGDPVGWQGELMRRADVAMYQARRAGRQLLRYTPGTDPADRDRLTLAGELPQAVAQRQFVLHFQPIVDITTGEVIGAEALARWKHPSRGELAPRRFLDLVERSAHLPAFTAAVLEEALLAAGMWRAAGHDLSVSVNISARSVLDTGLPQQVQELLRRHHTPPQRLCLELTETLALSQLDTVDQVLTRLHDLGVRLALDDFGTGFSSIGVVSRIPVHQLKIDRDFVSRLRPASESPQPSREAEDAAQARAVVRSTVQLGQALDLAVVAEGIETESQRGMLWELGCTLGQGHMFSPAVPSDQLLALLTRGVGGRPGMLATPLESDPTVVRLPRRRAAGQ